MCCIVGELLITLSILDLLLLLPRAERAATRTATNNPPRPDYGRHPSCDFYMLPHVCCVTLCSIDVLSDLTSLLLCVSLLPVVTLLSSSCVVNSNLYVELSYISYDMIHTKTAVAGSKRPLLLLLNSLYHEAKNSGASSWAPLCSEYIAVVRYGLLDRCVISMSM